MPNKQTRSKSRSRIRRRHTKRKHLGSTRPYPWKLSWIRASPFPNIDSAKKAELTWKTRGQDSIGFTAISSLKSMGRIRRSHGKYEIGDKYKVIR